MSERYILKDKQVVPEPDLIKWALWFETANNQVKRSELGDKVVSTIFLGLNFAPPGMTPQIFETAILDLKRGVAQAVARYASYEEAEAGHDDQVKRLVN